MHFLCRATNGTVQLLATAQQTLLGKNPLRWAQFYRSSLKSGNNLPANPSYCVPASSKKVLINLSPRALQCSRHIEKRRERSNQLAHFDTYTHDSLLWWPRYTMGSKTLNTSRHCEYRGSRLHLSGCANPEAPLLSTAESRAHRKHHGAAVWQHS